MRGRGLDLNLLRVLLALHETRSVSQTAELLGRVQMVLLAADEKTTR